MRAGTLAEVDAARNYRSSREERRASVEWIKANMPELAAMLKEGQALGLTYHDFNITNEELKNGKDKY